jgi:hypothetical protein
MPYDFGDDAVHKRVMKANPEFEKYAYNFWKIIFIIILIIYYTIG